MRVPGSKSGNYLYNNLASWRMSVTCEFGLSLQTLNTASQYSDGSPNPDFPGSCGWNPDYNKSLTWVDCKNFVTPGSCKWGPLGQYSGYYFLALFVGGVLARAGLFVVDEFL
jgi:hypothetical protein